MNNRALDGAEDNAASGEDAADIFGADDIDPVPVPARSRRHATTVVDGAACIACFEPLLPRGPICVVIVGGVMPCARHVDCDDPQGLTLPIDGGRRLF